MQNFILDINQFKQVIELSWYSIPVMILLNLLFLLLAIIFRRSDKSYQILIVYGLAALAQDFVGLFLPLTGRYNFFTPSFSLLSNIIAICFMYVEFIVFYLVYYVYLKWLYVLRMAKLLGLVYLLGIAYFLHSPHSIDLFKFLGCLSISSSAFLLIPAFYYYYQICKGKYSISDARFWIITGIASLNSLIIPLFSLAPHLLDQNSYQVYHVYSINYFSYCLLFAFFIASIFYGKTPTR
jgi:hypothetical protein